MLIIFPLVAVASGADLLADLSNGASIHHIAKEALIIVLSVMSLCGCVTRQTTYDSQGRVTDDNYVIERPVKKIIEKVEFE